MILRVSSKQNYSVILYLYQKLCNASSSIVCSGVNCIYSTNPVQPRILKYFIGNHDIQLKAGGAS